MRETACSRRIRVEAAAPTPRRTPADNFPIAPLVENYAPVTSPVNVAPTPGTANNPNQKVEVLGEPRTVKGHPCTLWDQDDIARYKSLLRTDKDFAKELEMLKARAERRIAMPLGVPGTHQGPDGKWLAPGDFPKDEPPNGNESTNSQANAAAMSDLATVHRRNRDCQPAGRPECFAVHRADQGGRQSGDRRRRQIAR